VILRSGPTAALLGIDRTTLHRWEKERADIRACKWKRGWFRVDLLAAKGLCQMPAPQPLSPRVVRHRCIERKPCA
jgi:hypothetical protein